MLLKSKIIAGVTIIIIAGIAVLFSYSRFKKIEHRMPPSVPSDTSILISMPVESVNAAIRELFKDSGVFYDAIPGLCKEFDDSPDCRPSSNMKAELFQAIPIDDPRSPGIQQFRLHGKNNPELAQYLAFSEADASHDLYLSAGSSHEYFWASEYFYRGLPVKFRTDFILHLEPASGGTATRIYAYEYLPIIWVGETFGIAREGLGLGFYYDMRWVAPTVRDTMELLDFLKKNL